MSEATKEDRRPARGRAVAMRLAALLLGVGFAWAVLEVVVRTATEVDADGNQTAFGGRLMPFHPPVEWTTRRVEELARGKHACFRYDAELGWTTNPRTRCRKGQYVYDTAGLRATDPRDSPPRGHEPGVLRIGLFGDSFTHGDDVPIEHSLRERGVQARVLNFGVAGYGLDQALLRWRKDGAGSGLDVVVLGFQSENILRSLNMIRVLYFWRTRLPFTKPRFVLRDDELVAINQPAVGPEALPAVLEDLEHWPLIDDEEFYAPEDFTPRWWHASRLLGYLAGWKAHHVGRLWYAEQARYYEPRSASARLALRILGAFEAEVSEQGAALYVVHLPKQIDLERMAEDPASLWYAALRELIVARHRWVETDAAFAEASAHASISAMYGGGEHYSPQGNAVVGQVVAEALAADYR